MQYQLHWDWPTLVNPSFQHLIHNQDRYLIMWGGRASSKSDLAVKKLLYRCLSERYFRCILIRQVYDKIKDSQYQNIKDIVHQLGLQDLFQFRVSPLEIVCVNGNKFIARGCDDPQKLKSVKDPSCAWYEEDIPEEDHFTTITTTIRSGQAPYLQEIFTINPEVEGNYEEHWFWKRFFKDHHPQKSFRATTTIKVDRREITQAVTVHHSTYHDNLWLPDENRAQLEQLQVTNPYYYQVYTLGLWGTKQINSRFYHAFNRAIHVRPNEIDPDLPLHISFDFNRKPYNTMTIWQFPDEVTGCQLDEICLTPPRNDDRDQCAAFLERYGHHRGGLFVYGDPSGKSEDTKVKSGENHFTGIMQELASMSPKLRMHTKAPAPESRGNWQNKIFALNGEGYPLTVTIDPRCTNTINDYLYQRTADIGGKNKKKVKDAEGDYVEIYGHTSDANDYLLCYVWSGHYKAFNAKALPTILSSPGKSIHRAGY